MKNRLRSLPQQGKMRCGSDLTRRNGWFRDRRQPAVAVLNFPFADAEIFTLDAHRDGARLAFTDFDAIHGTNWSHLSRRATEEELIRDVDELARQNLLSYFEPHVASDRDDGIARDALQNRRALRCRVEASVTNREEILTAAF